MSAVIEKFIVCDGACGENYGVDSRQNPISKQRKDAKAEGWTFRDGKDYCPKCTEKMVHVNLWT